MTDLIDRAKRALADDRAAKKKFDLQTANGVFATAARTLIPELIDALEAENAMLKAKLAKAVDMLLVADAALFAVGEVRSSFPRSAIITTLAKLKEIDHDRGTGE